MIDAVRRVVIVLFGIEALLGVQALARFLAVAATYDATVWAVTLARGLVTMGHGMTAVLLVRRAPAAGVLGRGVAVASAVLMTLEVGARFAPSSLPPGTRGPFLAAYWLYSIGIVLVLGRTSVP